MRPIRSNIPHSERVGIEATLTVSVAVAAEALLPALVCRLPADMLFKCAPMALEVTATMIVQPPDCMGAPLA